MAWNLTGTPVRGAGGEAGGPAGRQVSDALSVTEAVMRAKASLETLVLTVEGEVSQFKDSPAYKGVYFPLADGSSVIDCMIWRNRYRECGIELRPGMRIRVNGRFTVYPAKGRMQFEVYRIEPAGEGDLRARVAQLARRLQAEGLMDPSRKLAVPPFCHRVVVITSPHGKVKDDVARTLRRRNPVVELQYCSVNVEGATAAAQMVDALRVAAAAAPDAILLVRGGGSYEALMPFNDEGLARAIAACPVPVVTGIGHEPDTTIADMVADLRRSTPTAAAEAVAPAASDLLSEIDSGFARMCVAMRRRLADASQRLEASASRPVLSSPRAALIGPRAMQLDMASDRLTAAIPNALAHASAALRTSTARIAALGPGVVARRTAELDIRASRLRSCSSRMLEVPRRQLGVYAASLDALSPLAVIARGYAMALDEQGHVVSSARSVHAGDSLSVRVADGVVDCTVDGVRDVGRWGGTGVG